MSVSMITNTTFLITLMFTQLSEMIESLFFAIFSKRECTRGAKLRSCLALCITKQNIMIWKMHLALRFQNIMLISSTVGWPKAAKDRRRFRCSPTTTSTPT